MRDNLNSKNLRPWDLILPFWRRCLFKTGLVYIMANRKAQMLFPVFKKMVDIYNIILIILNLALTSDSWEDNNWLIIKRHLLC